MANQSPTWLEVVAGIPAAVLLAILLWWNPKGRRQWMIAAAMMVYVGCYYLVFVRHH